MAPSTSSVRTKVWPAPSTPAPGIWHILVTRVQGVGAYQITATTFAAPSCPGDCNSNGSVTIDELIKGVNIALENAPVAACAAFDTNHNRAVTVDELVRAVSSALSGCTNL